MNKRTRNLILEFHLKRYCAMHESLWGNYDSFFFNIKLAILGQIYTWDNRHNRS